jgi:Catalytic LigB subunit of aromatic ring-opening dioxygenase
MSRRFLVGDVLGLGLTHYPLLAGVDEHMADLLKVTLRDPDIPAHAKDVAHWSTLARAEWSDDGGTAAAATHRARLLDGLGRCRRELDAFEPDVLLVWGDDQYENFREEVIPSFCVLAYQNTTFKPFGSLNRLKIPNVWGLPSDQEFEIKGSPEFARSLARGVLGLGVDVAYSYEKRSGLNFPHAFANTQVFLDWDSAGGNFPYPIVALAVNCYGEHVIARQGGFAPFAAIKDEVLDPPGPTPLRCFQFGQAVAKAIRDSDKRVALVASSSWSHAFLNDKDWHLRPDTAADQVLYDALVRGDYDTWTKMTSADIVAAGQHEILNWYCMLGAMSELGLERQWSDFVITEIFNSNKAFAVFR